MQREPHLRIVIQTDGRCAIEARQFSGASCVQFTRQIQQALGGTVLADCPTNDLRPRLVVRTPLREGQS